MNKRYKYTNEDIEFLEEFYPKGDWDSIFKKFPSLTKSQIYNVCHKRGISANYKVKDLSCNFSSNRWTIEEDNIIINYYGDIPFDEIAKLLPNRTYNAIVLRANRLKILSYERKKQKYSDNDIDFIFQNWEKFSDYQLAETLGRTQRSIKWMRENLGLYRQDPSRNLSYGTLEKFLRGNTYRWKLKSMENCNYKCVITGNDTFDIHHLYSFGSILKSFAKESESYKDNQIDSYSKQELDDLVKKFNLYHDSFPLGVCICNELHKLFHHVYGKTNNTPEQWNEFVEDYKKGKYNRQPA